MSWVTTLTITSSLPTDLGHIPISAEIDFGALLRAAGAGAGARLDPSSVAVVDAEAGTPVAHHLSEDLAHGDCGRIEFVIRVEPDRPPTTRFEIHFDALGDGARRPHLAPRAPVPPIGVGDLLRHNADAPRPLTLFDFHLVDLDGDGRADLAGTWNYYHRPGEPRSGVVVYPRVEHEDSPYCFGDLVRLARRPAPGAPPEDFPGTYVVAAFADLDGDGRLELLFAERTWDRVEVHRDTGERDGGGWPVWLLDREIRLPAPGASCLRCLDLDGDGRPELIVDGQWIRNAGPEGGPFAPASPVDLGSGEQLDFLDLTGDGRLDLVCLTPRPSAVSRFPEEPGGFPGADVTWRPRLPGATPRFGAPQPVTGLPPSAHRVVAVRDGARPGLLVQHNLWQEITLFEVRATPHDAAGAEAVARMEAPNPPIALSDQSWPCPCDLDGNGVTDLLVGGGYGWPRWLRNTGSQRAPAWEPPRLVTAMGRPIRLQRDEILRGTRHWHNMGYPYPVFVDWDGDGLPDLMLPNETNRIFWHRNVGTRTEPAFGPRQQLVVDGYEDSQELRARAGRLALDKDLPNHPYPFDDASPFFWRCGACFADFTGDGMIDLVVHDEHRKLTLFRQYVDDAGTRRLRKDRRLQLVDGREIDDAIVGRDQHWTESFRAVDWDGDGRLDLIYNTAGSGHIYLLRNVGTAAEPVFDLPRQFRLYGEPFTPFTVHGPNCWPADLNDDGRPDLLGCVEWSVYPFFAHAALEMDRHPEWELGPTRALAQESP